MPEVNDQLRTGLAETLRLSSPRELLLDARLHLPLAQVVECWAGFRGSDGWIERCSVVIDSDLAR